MVSVIIVNYNGGKLLKDCLDSLRDQSYRNFEVIMVDNGSSDNSVDYIRKHYPDVKIVKKNENLGYGRGNNEGIKVARGKYIVFLNNDTKVDKNWLRALIKSAESNPDFGMFACKILNFYDPSIIDNTGLAVYKDGIARGRGRLEKDEGQYDREEEVFFPSGCAALYRKQMLDEIGLFDEDFFLYMEDVDIGLRARFAGWRCLYSPEAVVYHKYSATTEPYSPLKAFLVERNRLWMVIKCLPLSMIIANPVFTFIRYFWQIYGMFTGRGASSRLRESESFPRGVMILIKAYLSAFAGLGKMLRKRKRIMRMKKVSTMQIMEWFNKYGIPARELALKD